MDNLIKFRYRPDLDQRSLLSREMRNNLRNRGEVRGNFEVLVDRVEGQEGVKLDYCWSNLNSTNNSRIIGGKKLRTNSRTTLVFPEDGQDTVEYILSSRAENYRRRFGKIEEPIVLKWFYGNPVSPYLFESMVLFWANPFEDPSLYEGNSLLNVLFEEFVPKRAKYKS